MGRVLNLRIFSLKVGSYGLLLNGDTDGKGHLSVLCAGFGDGIAYPCHVASNVNQQLFFPVIQS